MFRSHEDYATGFRIPDFHRPSQARRQRRRNVVDRYNGIFQPVDLAEEIGSAEWFRGTAVLCALAAVAIAFWPDLTLIETAGGRPLGQPSPAKFSRMTIAPLSQGSATGNATPIGVLGETSRLQKSITLQDGESLGQVLRGVGVNDGDAATAAALINSAAGIEEPSAGTRIDVTAGASDLLSGERSLEHLTLRARVDLGLEVTRLDGRLKIVAKPLAVYSAPLRIKGTVGDGLYRSARNAGAPMKAIQQYLQTMAAHISLDEGFAPGDSFDMIVAYRRAADGQGETGQLLYAGLDHGGKPVAQLLRWGDKGGFVDAANPVKPTLGVLNAPVFGRLTSGFGQRRHPILGYTRMHGGVDFAAAWGSPIHAAADAVVSFAGWHGGHGNYVRLEHGGGVGTGYAHMSKFVVADGARVRAGEVIGYVGSTGLSTGPHLHYEMYRNGQRVNPLSGGTIVQTASYDAKTMAAIKARLAQMRAIAPGTATGSLPD